ncbi:MAG: hypothetical protein ACRD1R_02315 [Acidobacteriota bacterium]
MSPQKSLLAIGLVAIGILLGFALRGTTGATDPEALGQPFILVPDEGVPAGDLRAGEVEAAEPDFEPAPQKAAPQVSRRDTAPAASRTPHVSNPLRPTYSTRSEAPATETAYPDYSNSDYSSPDSSSGDSYGGSTSADTGEGAQVPPARVPSAPRPPWASDSSSGDSSGASYGGQSGTYTAPATAPARVPSAPRVQTAELPEGTVLEIRLGDLISTQTNQPGDPFEATLDRELTVNGRVVAPRGSRILGELVDVEDAGQVKGRARMALALNRLQVGDETYAIRTNTIRFEAKSTKERDAKVIGGVAGLGALLGGLAGGKKGAAVGATIGGATGTATVLATEGDAVEFKPEHKFSFRLEEDIQVQVH